MRTWVYWAWPIKWTQTFGGTCLLSSSEFCVHSCLGWCASEGQELSLANSFCAGCILWCCNTYCAPQKDKLRSSSRWYLWSAFYVPCTSCAWSRLILSTTLVKCGYYYYPTLPMKKWKHREVKELYTSSSRLSWWLSGKESACKCRRRRFDPWVGKIPWRRKQQPTPVFLPEKSLGQRSLAGYSPWCHKESDMTWRPNYKRSRTGIWTQINMILEPMFLVFYTV